MELSPLAREKLAKIGDLSSEEKEKLKCNEELTSLLSDYFTDKIDTDGLQSKLKKFKENGHGFMIKETQLRLLHAMTLGGNNYDFERSRNGILICETLKEHNRHSELERTLKSLESLRRQYHREKETAFDSLKEGIQSKVKMAAQQVARQSRNKNVSVDIEHSVAASVKASPQWRNFILEHEKTYGQRYKDCLAKTQMLI